MIWSLALVNWLFASTITINKRIYPKYYRKSNGPCSFLFFGRLGVKVVVKFFSILLEWLTFPVCFWIPFFSNLNSNCSDLSLFWANCYSDLKRISRSLEYFFLTVCQNNFCNKIPFLTSKWSDDLPLFSHIFGHTIVSQHSTIATDYWSIIRDKK